MSDEHVTDGRLDRARDLGERYAEMCLRDARSREPEVQEVVAEVAAFDALEMAVFCQEVVSRCPDVHRASMWLTVLANRVHYPPAPSPDWDANKPRAGIGGTILVCRQSFGFSDDFGDRMSAEFNITFGVAGAEEADKLAEFFRRQRVGIRPLRSMKGGHGIVYKEYSEEWFDTYREGDYERDES